MASHSHQITIDASKEEVFKAITTIDGLLGWYTAKIEGDAGDGEEIKLHFHSKDGPFHWKIAVTEPASTVEWNCIAGPGSSAGTNVTFHLSEKGSKTTVELDHEGLEEAHDKFSVCNTMWGALMLHLKKYVETKQPEPAFH